MRLLIRTLVDPYGRGLKKPYRGTRIVSTPSAVAKRLRGMKRQAETYASNPRDYAVRAWKSCIVEVTTLYCAPGWDEVKSFGAGYNVEALSPEEFLRRYTAGTFGRFTS